MVFRKDIKYSCKTYIRYSLFFYENRSSKDGKYTELAQHFQAIIQTIESMREEMNVFLILHSEDVQSDKVTTGYKVSTIGSLIDNQLKTFI